MFDTRVVRLWIALIGALIAALYGQFLHNPIVFDDLPFFMQSNDGHSAIEQFAAPLPYNLRALPYVTLAWTAEVFGYGLMPFRIGNLLLQWLVVIVLALFVVRLYQQVLPERTVDGRTGMLSAVLIVVSLFAVHPLGVYAAGYLVQRTIVMATLFSLLSLWAYLQGINGKKIWLWASVVLYLLATHSKEHVIMLPAVIVALTVLVHDDWRAFIRQNWPVFFGYVLVALLTVAQIRGVIGQSYEIYSADMLDGVLPEHAYAHSVLTQTWLFFKYGVLWLLPIPAWMSVDMREPLAQGVFSVYGVSLLAYLLYGIMAFRLLFRRGTQGLIGFALLFPWLMFATEFSTVRVQEIFVLYRSYIWAVGGVIVLPLLLMQLNVRLTLLVSVLIGATCFMVAMERLSTFSHPVLLWDDAEKLVKDRQSLPGVSRIYYNRGTAWLNEGRVDQALPDMLKATRLNPNQSAGFFNLALAYSRSNQNQLAIQAFSRAIALDEEQKAQPNFRYYYGRGMDHEALHQLREASIDFQVSCLLAKKGCDKTSLH